ncbi:short-chain dehydrogenase/reductase family 9C member 7-like [Amblyomma americanum]
MLTVNRLLVLVTPCLWALGSTLPVVQQISVTFGFALITLLVGYWFLWYGRRLLFNGSIKPSGKAVLITGCDTGIGHLLAEQLANDGFHVFAGCLDASGVGARKLQERSGIRVLQMDVTVEEEIEAAVEKVEKELDNLVLWAVVCNAGVASIGYIDLQPMSRVRRVFDVNTFGMLSVATAFLPLLKKSRGRIVVVASLLGRVPVPECLAYCTSKMAAISLADGLRRQYYGKGVHVCTVEPTGYRTAIADHSLLEKGMDADLKMLPPKIREGLDEQFVNRRRLASRRLLSWFLRDDPREAADAIRTAVLELAAKAHYTCGGRIYLIYRLLMCLLPAEVIDEGMYFVRSMAATLSKRK